MRRDPSATRSGAPREGYACGRAPGGARAHDGIIACGLAAIWLVDSARNFGRETLPHNYNS